MNPQSPAYDLAVVGAGAAGLMAAITAARQGLRVLLLDGKEKPGAKILMSGGTRCNVTNFQVTPEDYETETPRALRNILQAFPSEAAAAFFENLGVSLVLEEGGKYFPATHSAKTVLEALIKEASLAGVCLKAGFKVGEAVFLEKNFYLRGQDFEFRAPFLILATGGLSYPGTGSDGSGFEIAKAFGHGLIPTTPSLTPLLSDDPAWKSLSGIAVSCRLGLWKEGRKVIDFSAPILFTHFGFSGPAALNISRHWIRMKDSAGLELAAHFLEAVSETEFRSFLQTERSNAPGISVKKFMSRFFPERFAGVVLSKTGIAETTPLGQWPKADSDRVIGFLRHAPLQVRDVFGYQKAEATAGGVDLRELDSRTLESKLRPGLFFAGEMLDVDGRIGGFNFQWAWSSGRAAALGVAKKIADVQPQASS